MRRRNIKVREALIAWEPNLPNSFEPDPLAGTIRVGKLLDEHEPDWTRPLTCTGGAAEVAVRALSGDAAKVQILSEFHWLVVGQGLDAQTVHEAFMPIEEYRAAICRDFLFDRDPDEFT